MMRGTFLCCFPNARRAKFGMIGVGSFDIAKRERIRPISRIGRIGRSGEGGVFQNVNVLFAMIGSGGGRVRHFGRVRRGLFPGNSFYIAKRCPYKWVAGSGGRTGSFSGGGAVMAPLRRAGLTGSLLFQGDRSDLGLRGREGCRAGLPFRSALLREADRGAGRGRGWATDARGDGSRW